MEISGVRTTSLVDGIGINYVIFAQGCTHHCENCHNPESWALDGGYQVSVAKIISSIEPYLGFITGVTFSGGDPVLQLSSVHKIAEWAKKHGLTTTLYTGYYIDYVVNNFPDEIKYIDYIIDGKFSYVLTKDAPRFRGSSNQMMYQQIKEGEWKKI